MKTKTIAASLLLLCFCLSVKGQDVPPAINPDTETTDENAIYDPFDLEVKPEYPGGISAFYAFLAQNLRVPEGDSGSDQKLKIYVSFVIEKDGSLTDIKILREPGHGLGNETKKVLAKSPKWSPGKRNGKPVRTRYSLPLVVHPEGYKAVEKTETPQIEITKEKNPKKG